MKMKSKLCYLGTISICNCKQFLTIFTHENLPPKRLYLLNHRGFFFLFVCLTASADRVKSHNMEPDSKHQAKKVKKKGGKTYPQKSTYPRQRNAAFTKNPRNLKGLLPK